jgi:flagellar hook-length control protein FliK
MINTLNINQSNTAKPKLNGTWNDDKNLNNLAYNRKFSSKIKKDFRSDFQNMVEYKDPKLKAIKKNFNDTLLPIDSPYQEIPLGLLSAFSNGFSSVKEKEISGDLLAMQQSMPNDILASIKETFDFSALKPETREAISLLDSLSEKLKGSKSIAINDEIQSKLSEELDKLGLKMDVNISKEGSLILKGKSKEAKDEDMFSLLKNLSDTSKEGISYNDSSSKKAESNELNSMLENMGFDKVNSKINKLKEEETKFNPFGSDSLTTLKADDRENPNFNQDFQSGLGFGTSANQIGESSNNTNNVSSSINELPATIVRFIETAREEGSAKAIINLNPDNLGKLQIELKVSDSNLLVNIQAENETTKELIMENISELKELVKESGLNLENIEFGNYKDENNQNYQSNKQHQDAESRKKYLDWMKRFNEVSQSFNNEIFTNN